MRVLQVALPQGQWDLALDPSSGLWADGLE